MNRLGAFGLGLTQVRRPIGQPYPGSALGSQPSIGTIWQSTSNLNLVTNQSASSPMVKPWRIGNGPAPTKLSAPGRNIRPSTGRPIGFGRSSTHTDLRVLAASSSTYRSVVMNV